ncbi:AME1 (YBR211C) [Zygosaccharomyces parabailii]|uniref:BN860_13476g1_1 n=1 Tax=Zygosaccharomyces bailii (strain CLIB 213 / ATCC 58445 / CBS 680 / BCRC 21525 / NBRC 1098 / NCYC 1416 / NRRL Y-2227) TaxID=1333698 RepID=A0A8J2T3S8_ZYGB2|nr:AME1 (YBR211C) [Zygosaccharomyces parabailii]CDF88575.1 BN860_13476g1_1 [Zygosaccharomyces bailii CLIB 213]
MDLTDRGVKLLYRQRGSHLRRIDGEIGTVVIEDTAQESLSPELPETTPDGALEEDILNDIPDLNDQLPETEESPHEYAQNAAHKGSQDVLQEIPQNIAQEASEGSAYGGQPNRQELETDFNQYHFEDIPLRQLSSSITSITSIDVLRETFANLFQSDLIPQAKRHFEQGKDRQSKMVHKLDVRIFQRVAEQLGSDFQDILDINMSNNELCYQLKQLIATKDDLNQQLVSTQAELQQLLNGSERHQLQEFQDHLNQRLRLNAQLNELHQVVQSPVPPPGPAELGPHKYTINDLCDSLNPHTGLLARIQPHT